MPRGTRWARCCNSIWHRRGLQAGKEFSLPRLSCQNHLFSFVQCSSTLPRPVFLRTALWGLKDERIQPKKRKPWINEIKGNVVRFYIPAFHITENISKLTRMFFCCQTLTSLALQNAKRLGWMLERVFLFLFQKGRSQTEPRPGIPGQMSCQHAKDAEPSLLLLSAPRWAAALHHPPSRRDHEVGTQKHLPSIPCFHIWIKKCSLRLYIPWRGRIFNNTSSIHFHSGHTSNLAARLPGAKSQPKPPILHWFDPKWSKPEEGKQSQFLQQHPSATEAPSGISPNQLLRSFQMWGGQGREVGGGCRVTENVL